MAFRNKKDILKDFSPDIAIIQECENEDVLKSKKAVFWYEKYIWIWKNKNKGLGVMSFNGFQIELLDHNEDYKYILPVRVFKKEIEYILLAIWTQMVNDDIRESYVVQAARSFVWYQELLKQENILIIGDFNSNAIWDFDAKKEYNHAGMVDLLVKNDIHSLYHERMKEFHWKESMPTLYFTRNQNKPYHIDYSFMKQSILKKVKNFSIGKYEDWIGKSDHMPIFIDIED